MKKNGMTLVEVVVTIAIMIVMSAAGFNFVQNFQAKEDLNSAASTILSTIKYARNMAISRQKPAGFSGSPNVVRVDFLAGGNVAATAVGGASQVQFNAPVNYDNEGKISVSPVQIRFTALDGKLASSDTGTPLAYDQNITLIVSTSEIASTKTIIINSNGTIRE